MSRKRYTNEDIAAVGRMYLSGVAIAEISRRLKVPYRTCSYWIRSMKDEGLPKVEKSIPGKIKFGDIVKNLTGK